MTVVAGMAIASSAFALTNCVDKTDIGGCSPVAFKLTASGKTVTTVEKKDVVYKTVSSLKISKGYLVMLPGGVDADGMCCYDDASIYAVVKAGKVSFKAAINFDGVKKWSIFGYNFADAMEKNWYKVFSCESDLGFEFDDGDGLVVDDELYTDIGDVFSGLQFYMTSFGKAKYGYSEKATKSYIPCGKNKDKDCVIVADWGPYNGWFAGWFDIVSDGEYGCFNCECGDVDLLGGTWKASSPKLMSWEKAQRAVWGFADGDYE